MQPLADGSIAPMLATEWAFVDGGAALELELRDGVSFHDGRPFDAAAVRANLEQAMRHPEATVVRQQLEPISTVEVVDRLTVRIHVSRRAAGLPYYLGTAAGMMASPAWLDGDGSTWPVGSGPYVLDADRVVPGERAGYVTAPGRYWDPATQPFDEITIVGIGSDRRRVEALLDGSADVAGVRGQGTGPALRAAAEGAAALATYAGTVSLAVQLSRSSPALADVRVRRALNLAVDRQAILDAAFASRGSATCQPLRAGMPGHDPDLEASYPYDPTAARRLLAAAGADGLRLTGLQLIEGQRSATPLELVRDQLSLAGVDLEVVSLPPVEMLSTWVSGGADVRTVFAPVPPHAALTLWRRLNPLQSPGDLSRMSADLPPLVDHLLDQRMEAGEAVALYARVNRLVVEDAVVVEIARLDTDVLARTDVAGIDTVPAAILNTVDVRHLGRARA